MASSIEIFYSYAHKDEKLREELEKQLSLLKWQGIITSWHDRKIAAGQEWVGEINIHLNTAQIILLLISPDFMASNYCFSIEVKRALERHERGEARVIPIILRPVYWQGAPFGKLQALPTDGKPITDPDWQNLDRAFFNVAEGIRKLIELFSAQGVEREQIPEIEEDQMLNSKWSTLQTWRSTTGGRSGMNLGVYRIIRQIGKGSFSEIYLGRHLQQGNLVAIKIFPSILHQDIGYFVRGGIALANLVHPHIVRIHDCGVEEETPYSFIAPYMVMDYAPNGNLRQRHPRGSRLPISTIVSYVKQIADALQYAHNNHVVHRDIKPENILLGDNYEILLSDFTISLPPHTDANPSESMIATVPYMAPEQINQRITPKSDQYALGILVYELLSGAYPFSGTLTEIAIQHMIVPPPALHDKIPIARKVESVIMKALAKDEQQRFPTIRDFANALDQACQS